MRAFLATFSSGLLLALAPVTAWASPSFTSADYALPGTSASSFAGVALGDLDGRNGPDILVPQHDADGSWLFLNRGDGTFAAASRRATCAGDHALPLIGQFTPDANPDVLLPCAGGEGRFGLLPGDGAGGLGSETDISLQAQYHGIAGRLDGRADVIFPGGFGSTWTPCFVAVADLSAPTPSATCDGVQAISHFPFAVGDLFAPGANPPYDRDQLFGLADEHTLYVVGYDPQGPGGWSYTTRAIGGNAVAQDIAAGDVNGDGLQDVVIGDEGSLSVFLSQPPTGGIPLDARATDAGGSIEVPDHEVLELADFDGDGRTDVLAGGTDSQLNPEFAIMLGHGDGTFAAPVRFSTQFPREATSWWLAVGDVDGDGRPDVVVADGDERVVRVFLNTTPAPAGSVPGAGPGVPGPGGGPGPGGAPGPGPGGPGGGPPVISHVRQSAAKWRAGSRLARIARTLPVGTTFRFTLNEAARVRFAFTQRAHGRRVTRGTLRFAARAGSDKVRFQGRITRHRSLKPGRYRLVIGATDAHGRSARPRGLSFSIAG